MITRLSILSAAAAFIYYATYFVAYFQALSVEGPPVKLETFVLPKAYEVDLVWQSKAIQKPYCVKVYENGQYLTGVYVYPDNRLRKGEEFSLFVAEQLRPLGPLEAKAIHAVSDDDLGAEIAIVNVREYKGTPREQRMIERKAKVVVN